MIVSMLYLPVEAVWAPDNQNVVGAQLFVHRVTAAREEVLTDPMVSAVIVSERSEKHEGGRADGPVCGALVNEDLVPAADNDTAMGAEIGLRRLW